MTTQSNPLFAGFVALLIDTLAGMVPGTDDDTNTLGTRRDLARILFEAFKPRDAVEAMLAARAVAAHHATMNGFTRAAAPGLSDETVIRLRANAIAASRSFDAVLRTLDKRRKEAAEPASPPVTDVERRQTAAQPAPHPTLPRMAAPFLPEALTRSARRAAYHGSTALAATLCAELVPAGP
jgi:hypothetical protein